MEVLVKYVWERILGSPSSMLVLGAFPGHLPEELKVKLQRRTCDLFVFPGEIISQLQPLDSLAINQLKVYLRMKYEIWLLPENLLLTRSGKIKRASASKLAKWVSAA
jgi:hypothetical protein